MAQGSQVDELFGVMAEVAEETMSMLPKIECVTLFQQLFSSQQQAGAGSGADGPDDQTGGSAFCFFDKDNQQPGPGQDAQLEPKVDASEGPQSP